MDSQELQYLPLETEKSSIKMMKERVYKYENEFLLRAR